MRPCPRAPHSPLPPGITRMASLQSEMIFDRVIKTGTFVTSRLRDGDATPLPISRTQRSTHKRVHARLARAMAVRCRPGIVTNTESATFSGHAGTIAFAVT
jgi:hypothetical protein